MYYRYYFGSLKDITNCELFFFNKKKMFFEKNQESEDTMQIGGVL